MSQKGKIEIVEIYKIKFKKSFCLKYWNILTNGISALKTDCVGDWMARLAAMARNGISNLASLIIPTCLISINVEKADPHNTGTDLIWGICYLRDLKRALKIYADSEKGNRAHLIWNFGC